MTARQTLIEKAVGLVNAARPSADDIDRLVEEVVDELAWNEFRTVTVNTRLLNEIKRHERLGWYLSF